MNRTLTSGLMALTLLTAGCSVDPVGTCKSLCEEQRSRMCNGFAGDENCVALCASVATEYDTVKADMDRIGCGSEFDRAYSCSSGGDFCDNTRCSSEIEGLVTCGRAFCMANPTDSLCTTP